MLQQHARTNRRLGPVVALAVAVAAFAPTVAVAKPILDPVSAASPKSTTVSQNLVSPDARDAGTSSLAGTVSPQNLVSPDARDAGSSGSAGTVSSQSLVSPDTRDAGAGVVVSQTPAPAPANVKSSGGVEGWDTEVILGLGAALLMGLAGVGLLARARTQHHPRPRTR